MSGTGYEKLSSLANNREAVKSNEMKEGDVVEGYLVKVTEKPNRNPKYKQPNVSIFLIDADGQEKVVFASGNLTYIKGDLEKAAIPAGTKLRLTRVAPPPQSNYKHYFDVAVNREDMVDLARFGAESEGAEY